MSGDENRRQLAERARQAGLAVAAERERSAAEAERPLVPGDLFADRRTAELPVEWAVIGEERAASGGEAGAGETGGVAGAVTGSAGARTSSVTAAARLLVVPADSFPLRGPADVAVAPGSSADPLTLRCAHGVWIEAARLAPAAPAARLPDRAVTEAHERHRAAADAAGELFGTPLEREAAIDPEYRHWVESVLVPARRAMAAAAAGGGPAVVGPAGAATTSVARSTDGSAEDPAATEPPTPVEPPAPTSLAERGRRASRPPVAWALAASVLLLVAAGLLAGMLRQRHEVAELRAAETRLSRRLGEVSAERNALRDERERLERRLSEGQSAAEAVQRDLREQLVELDRRLSAALSPRAFVGLPFALLVEPEPERGEPEPVEVPARAELVGLLLQYVASDDQSSYRLELHRGEGEGPLWAADDVPWNATLFGFVVLLPAKLLAPGEYRLEVYGAAEGGARPKVAEYEMVVERP